MTAYKDMIVLIITSALFIMLGTYIYTLKERNKELKSDIKQYEYDNFVAKQNTLICEQALEKQNKEIEILKVAEEIKRVELRNWKNKPPNIKYKIIEKIREVKSNECNDTKSTLDGIRTINFNEL